MKKEKSRSQLKAIFANLGGLARGLLKAPSKEPRSYAKDTRARGGQALSRFLRESKGKALGKEEEQEVYKMLKSRDPIVRQFGRKKLLDSHGGLVVSIAKKYQHQGMPLEDLIQEGNIGLITAMQKFNPSRGAKFSTHATNWIRQGISRSLEEHGQVIRQPANIKWELNKIRLATNKFQLTEGREPTTRELSRDTSIPVVRLEKLKEDKKRSFVSTAKKIGNKDEGDKQLTIEDILASPSSNPEEVMHEKADLETASELENHLHLLMASQLSPIEKKIVVGAHGIIGEALSYTQLGKKLNLSKQRIHQIHQHALDKLRNPSFIKIKEFGKALGEL